MEPPKAPNSVRPTPPAIPQAGRSRRAKDLDQERVEGVKPFGRERRYLRFNRWATGCRSARGCRLRGRDWACAGASSASEI